MLLSEEKIVGSGRGDRLAFREFGCIFHNNLV